MKKQIGVTTLAAAIALSIAVTVFPTTSAMAQKAPKGSGSQLMTEQERLQHQQRMQNAQTAAERERIRAEHGRIDVLFLNAGIARFAPWEQHSEEDFDRQFAINVKGPWLAIKHAITGRPGPACVLINFAASVSPMEAKEIKPLVTH